MRISAGGRFTWLVIGSAFLACIVTFGGIFWMSGGSAVDGVLDASWTAPATNADGSPLTDLVSYRVYYSTTNPPCPGGQFVVIASATARPASEQKVSVRLTGLAMGQLYYVAITSVNSRGLWSRCSPVVSARARRP